MTLEDLKKEYNYYLAREKKAEKFIDGNPKEVYERFLPEYLKVIQRLSQLIYDYKYLTGQEMTMEEKWNGFSIN